MLEFFTSLNDAKLVRFIEARLHCGLMQRQVGADSMIWSRGVYALFDLDPEIDQPSFSLLQSMIHPEDRVTIAQANAWIQAAKPSGRQFRVIRRDGTMRVLGQHFEVLFDSNGKPDRSMILVWDTTEQVDLQDRVAELQGRLEAIAQDSRIILNVLRPDGFVTGIVGTGPKQASALSLRYGYQWHDVVHPEDRAGSLAAFEQAVTERRDVMREHRVKEPDGQYRWRRASWIPVFSPKGALTEFVSVSIDIESEKKLPTFEENSVRKITGAQIRAARAILRWSVQDLADKAGVSPSSVRRVEENDGVTAKEETLLSAIASALVSAGVELVFPSLGKPAARPA